MEHHISAMLSRLIIKFVFSNLQKTKSFDKEYIFYYNGLFQKVTFLLLKYLMLIIQQDIGENTSQVLQESYCQICHYNPMFILVTVVLR